LFAPLAGPALNTLHLITGAFLSPDAASLQRRISPFHKNGPSTVRVNTDLKEAAGAKADS
jgi:hypothetical protein